jgi:hypothetical protein
VRAALGAGRLRVLRLVLLESVIVALGGGLLGVAVAFVGVRALRDSIPVNYPAWLSFEVDWRVLAYAFALSVGTGLLVRPRPGAAGHASRARPDAARAGAREQWRRRRAPAARRAGRHRAGALAGAAGGRRSDDQEHAAPAGDRSRLPRGRRAGGARAHGWGALRRDHRAVGAARERGRPPGRAPRRGRRLRHLGGAAQRLSSGSTFVVEGREVPVGEAPSAETRAVLPGYFRALELPLLAGRDFTAAEAADTAMRAVIVNETMARRWWPGADAIGRRVSITAAAPTPAWMTVVGVTRDVRQRRLGRAAEEQLYLPFAAMTRRDMTLMVRTAGDPEALAPAVRDALAGLDAGLPVVEVETMTAIAHRSLWLPRLYGVLFGAFAGAAVLLAVVGVYGVIAYAVAQRGRELGVRVALGARPRDVARLLLADGARLAALGLGLPLALAATGALRSTLHGVSPRDPAVLLATTVLLAAAALLATWVPARRAARVDPITALRAD